ncbi:hypothetical protein [Halorussus caseinilyticus]|uniref:Secreted protein n=1 Tax=Halorussus caseinilyticus TaxID=3034025 RepID=A0ABD5WPA6_9EURY
MSSAICTCWWRTAVWSVPTLATSTNRTRTAVSVPLSGSSSDGSGVPSRDPSSPNAGGEITSSFAAAATKP